MGASCIHMCVLTTSDSKHLLHRPFMIPPVTQGAVPFDNNSKAAQCPAAESEASLMKFLIILAALAVRILKKIFNLILISFI